MTEIKSKKSKILLGEFSGETVESCVKKYGRMSLLEILKWYDISDELLDEYHFKKKDVEPVEDVEYGYNEEVWDEYWESVEFDKQYDDFIDDEYWYDLYQEEYQRPLEPEPESSLEEQMKEDMYNNGYKFWIYG